MIMKNYTYILILTFSVFSSVPYLSVAQERKLILRDSISVKILPKYDSVSKVHRFLFGENYRKEYAALTKIPVLRISTLFGGLKATALGGGNQSKSLRLEDAAGNEYALRMVEKFPEVLLPESLRKTFAGEVIKDNMSAQHPFSALIVPPLAKATGLYHTNPIIGWVSEDAGLGEIGKLFANTVCLLEERYPVGHSENTTKMLKKLSESYDNQVDIQMMVKAKCLDYLIGDWDRHEDQWRWYPSPQKGGILYQPVARDRDQVFYRSDGMIQRMAQSSWLLPMMQGYERDVKNINWFLWEGREMNSRIFDEISQVEWDSTVVSFSQAISDDVLADAVSRLPEPGYSMRKDQLLSQLKLRRKELPEVMAKYYRFFNRIVDIPMSDKSERLVIGSDKKQLFVKVYKANRTRKNPLIYSRTFDEKITKEIRVYLRGGEDSVFIDNKTSGISVRVIGGDGRKEYLVTQGRKVRLYEKGSIKHFNKNGISLRLSEDSANTAFLAKDMYKRKFIFPNLGYNNDDGLEIGAGINFTNPGFRKVPYASNHSLSFLYSFGTSAFRVDYFGEWLKTLGKADITLRATIKAPSNTQNFFGLGNQTPYDGDQQLSYYRARFNLYKLDPAVRWRGKKFSLSVGPSLEYYTYDKGENDGRLIGNPANIHSSDSLTVDKNKLFVGAVAEYIFDTRNSSLLPTKGINLNIRIAGSKGLNSFSNNYGQLNLSLAVYEKLDDAGHLILANRFGGGLTLGKPAFYQAQFLGGQGNLLGFRQYRFAGEQSVYNNLELRWRLADLASYVLPGQLGILGQYDLGRVWKKDETSNAWHHGLGGGLYFAPAGFMVIRAVAVRSNEGWYPYLALSFRY